MPRDNKSALIQKIAKQAFITFKDCRSASSVDGNVLTDKLNELISLVTSVRAKDLKMMAPKNRPSSGAAEPQSPPVSYMHICETEVFSMGVFLLKTGTSIPLHDHPGMNGMIKVLYGKISVRCFDKLENSLTVPPDFDPQLAPLQTAGVWRSVLRSVAEYSENSGPCLLTPVRDNLHQIDAVDGPAAFLDILAPPYNPDDGRDCHYYKVLHSVTEPGTGAKVDQEQLGEKENEGWLLEIPQPEDFWCGGEPYPGPVVDI
ncbi:2-aminoethanethiol (cysteamine) dioxygenase a [Fundulus heteroclitus]|uniref:2-aminoethanethiol dioxygenase n=1 Tax=Fundulus heteroclitus TaxID=8078 RepID=A0A146ZJJ4_FUNHE|nr:2-aminoethanethiol (cysteamine) dioxygenase a [Fundulus heteroclitus]